MQLKPKIIGLLSVTIIFTFSVKTSFAQYPGMSRVYSNIAMQNAVRMSTMNMNSRRIGMSSMLTVPNSSEIEGAANEYDYYVKMKDGTNKYVGSYIYTDTILHKNYLLFVDKSYPKSDTAHRKQKIYTDKTISISRDIAFASVVGSKNRFKPNPIWFTGMPTDSCWMFKVVSGQINLYSYLSETGDSELFDSSTIIGIQTGSGAIEKYTADNIKKNITADADAMELFDKKNYWGAIKRYNKNILDASKK